MRPKKPGKGPYKLLPKFCGAILALSISTVAVYTAVADTESGTQSQDKSSWNIPYADLGSNELNYSYSMNLFSVGAYALDDKENETLLNEAGSQATAAMKTSSIECSSESGLGGVQARDIEDAKKQASVGLDLNKVFQYGKEGGCFNALMEFPDLSVAIPSYTDIFKNVMNALAKYATRKVCNAVNDTLEEAVSPITGKLDEISERGQLDLNGQVNKEITKKMYDMDAELGRQHSSTKPEKEIELSW